MKKKYKIFNSYNQKELAIANKVVKSGILSKFLGQYDKDFYGGKYVQKFERNIEKYFKVKYAVTVNSWTSGLTACVGALEVEPGDEIILPSWTMCACASAILQWNAIPVFADIDPQTFTISVDEIKKKITNKTKAIMAVDIFGQSCDYDEINKIAKKYNLKVISDAAQSIGSKYKGKFSGTLGDVGGFSFNCHKIIRTGEGGVCITNSKKIYKKLLLIRNHGEAVVEKMSEKNIVNIIGSNFRLGEVEAAVGIEQLKKLKRLVKQNQVYCNYLTKKLKNLNGIIPPKTLPFNTHAYYVYPIKLDLKKIGVNRKKIFKELEKLNVPAISEGYGNIHLLPMFQKKIAYGKKGFPWSLNKNKVNYSKGTLPISENLRDKNLICLEMCVYAFSKKDIEFIANSFSKVWKKLKI